MNAPATRPAARAGKQPTRAAAAAAACCFAIAIAGFETALALGAPLGRAAWGGTHVYLTEGLRIASVFAALFWARAVLRTPLAARDSADPRCPSARACGAHGC